MSTRTIIEINHDHLHRLKEDPEFWRQLMTELGGTRHNEALNRANNAGNGLEVTPGVRILLQRHHTTETVIKTNYSEVQA